MATIIQTSAGTWKAIIRKSGWPTDIKTLRLKRDAEDWATLTEGEMVRGVYIRRATADRTMVAEAVDRYLREVTPTKEESTQEAEIRRAETLKKCLGKYSMAALTPDVIANFRDERLAGTDRKDKDGIQSLAPTIRLDWNWLFSATSSPLRPRNGRWDSPTTRC
jgi:hypothetical protein